uniref:uncharacterized protein LOC108950541 n=1 Tax=Ciona intestinalis TaxID=7719 RepID=UPI000EF4CD61|nr:uncharacterized protein LOC108950541 [Ciona intestinalis]|eukprot:XP_026695195.1 uncharacterized protein LOC108950541 [Ciona intestinalis]
MTSQLALLQPQYKDLNINMQCSPSPSYSVNIVLKACSTGIISPGVILSKQSTSPCGYGCTARFSCAAGYTGNTVDATCNEQATWSPAPNCSLVQPHLTISLPTTGNTATKALGISNLKIITTISVTTNKDCVWKNGNKVLLGQFYSEAFGCYNFTSVNESITCVNNAGTVTSQLTLLQPQYKDLNINMQCSPSPSYSVNIVLKACSSPTTSNVQVNPSSGVYNTQADFQCSHGSTLFYVNGTTGNTATKCLATAEWENEKIVQCWAGKAAQLRQVKFKVQEQQNTIYENTSSKQQYMDFNTGKEMSFNLGSGPMEETYTSMSGIEDKNKYEI